MSNKPHALTEQEITELGKILQNPNATEKEKNDARHKLVQNWDDQGLIQTLPSDKNGLILDPNNPVHREWMSDENDGMIDDE